MKKIALITAICTSIFFACKKEDKTVEPTPVTPTTPICTTCPYCVKDTVLADTNIHFKATIDSTLNFTASNLWDTIIGSGPTRTITIIGKNTFAQGSPELKLNFVLSHYPNTTIGDSIYTANMSYRINNIVYHSKKGLLRGPQNIAITNQFHVDEFSMNFCFNTDTINGVSHKIKLGSVKVKHP